MNRQLIKDAFGWGVLLWLIGYGLGIALFTLLPPRALGWVITPIGIAITLWVLFRKVKGDSLGYYLVVGLAWTAIAIVGDYLFIVRAFRPADGYYKPDVYLYYALTFALPIAVGWWKSSKGR